MGAYNYKLLYEVDTQTYARKLLGLFVFSDEAKAYITRIGKNPFPKHERHFVIDPYRAGRPITPPTTPTVPATQNPTASKTDDALLKELSSAYHAKDYTRTLKITDDYLKNNAPTYDILRYRYRVFFIMKDYSKSISEIEKMESLGMVDRITACDAYVIATWAGKKALADGYKSRAGTCRTN